MALTPELVDLINNEMLHAARFQSVLFVRFRAESSVALIDELERLERLVVARSGKVGVLLLVPPAKQSAITEEVKERSAKMVQSMGADLVGTSTIILGKGIGAALVRAFVAGWLLFAKSPSPQSAFGSIDKGLEWLGSLPGGDDARALTGRQVLAHFGLDADGLPVNRPAVG